MCSFFVKSVIIKSILPAGHTLIFQLLRVFCPEGQFVCAKMDVEYYLLTV